MKIVATIVTCASKADFNSMHIEQAKSLLVNAGAELIGIKWLRPEIAFEIYFNKIDINKATEALFLLSKDYDVAVQKDDDNRLKKILLADMDSTMITMESIDRLADELGFGEAVSKITDQGMRGEIDFDNSLRQRIKLFKDTPASSLNIILDKIEYSAGAKTTINTMRNHGAYCALVSGGFTFTTEVVYKKLGFNEHHANQLLIKNNKLTGDVIEPILGPNAKREIFNKLSSKRDVTPSQICTIGDGANDIPMLKAAGLGIAYYGKPIVKKSTEFQINHSDLTTLLYYQGISYGDFITA